MQKFKEKIRTSGKGLNKILLVLLCFFLPGQVLYWTLCTSQDRNIPPNTEVIVSACTRPVVRGVPGGEVLFVHEKLTDRMYLLDLRTGEKRKVPKYPLLLDKGVFLSSELVWLKGSLAGPDNPTYRPHYILDLTDGQRYELLDLMLLPSLENNKFNPDNYSYIQSADHVFIDLWENELIALSPDFRTNKNGRVIFGYISDDDEFLLKLVKNLGMDYENVDSSRSGPRFKKPSPKGKLYVLKNGIYLSNTNALFESIPYLYFFRSWYYDESGVVIHDDYGTYWIMTQFFGDYYHLSYPVLKLRLPTS